MSNAIVQIKAPNIQFAKFHLRGQAPFVQNNFGKKAREEMREKHAAGGAASGNKKREAKDFDRLFKESQHLSREGWNGVPCAAFRNGMISACRTVGFKMTHAKLAAFIEPDGFDALDGTPLVRIVGDPRPLETMTRNDNGAPDIRVRAMWESWSIDLTVKFDADMFTLSDVTNLLHRVGQQVGVGEGRPDSKKSGGMGWGLFTIEGK